MPHRAAGSWCWRQPSLTAALALTAVLVLAAVAGVSAAVKANGCWHDTHFQVAGGTAECQTKCKSKLAAAKGVGSIWPETYTVDGHVCCKCQYRKIAVKGDPTPDSGAGKTTTTTSGSADGPVDPADAVGDDAMVTDADLAQQQADVAAGKKGKKKSGFAWWKLVIVCSILALVIVVTSGALFFDCCKCRRRRGKEEVAELRDSVREEMDKRKGKKGGKGGKHLSEEAQKRLEALDLALEVRQTKLEAQQNVARFEIVVAAGTTTPAEPAAGVSSSVPTSPVRSRYQRMREALFS